MLYLRTTIIGLLALPAYGAAPMYPVPKGAAEVGHVVLTPGVAEQDHYVLEEKYPGTSAHAHYEKVFRGWRSCYWRQRGWQQFGDSSGSRAQYLRGKGDS